MAKLSASATIACMSFSIRMASEDLAVEPGSSVPLTVEVVNESSERNEFEFSVEGLDPEWVAIPVPTIWIDPADSTVERVFLKPPRQSESKAGVYPFIVKVRSMDTGEVRTVQCSLTLNSFSHLSVEIDPKRASVNLLSREASFDVALMNLGNTEQNVQLFASDIDDAIAYDFSTHQVALSPGQTRNVQMSATASKVKAFSATSIAPVTVSARSIDNPSVAASAQIHIEIRPLIATGPLIAILAVIVMAIGWFLSIPKPPVIDSFSATERTVIAGTPTTIKWQSSHARAVRLTIGDETEAMLAADDSYTFTPVEPGQVEVTIIAVSGDVESKPQSLMITVEAPPVVPEPTIDRFAAENSQVPLGTPVVFRYTLGESVTSAYLEPHGPVDPRSTSIQVDSPPDDLPGKGVKTVVYTLIARNEAGKEVRKQVTVRFVKDSQAKIAEFVADPVEVDPLNPRVTLRWQVQKAVRLQLQYGDNIDTLAAMADQRDYLLSGDTTFTLIATDEQGLETRKQLTVRIKKEEPPEPPTSTGDPGTTGSTGSTTGASTGTAGTGNRPPANPGR